MSEVANKNPKDKIIERGGLFIISFQLEGLCTGLRLTVPHGLAPGKEKAELVFLLQRDLVAARRDEFASHAELAKREYAEGRLQFISDLSELRQNLDAP